MVYCDGWCCIRNTPRDGGKNGAHTKDPPMDETANGAQQGSTDDEAALSIELLTSYMICAKWLKMEYFSNKKFSNLGTSPRIHLDGWCCKCNAPRHDARMNWWMMQQTEHTQSTAMTIGSSDGRLRKRST